MPKQRNVEPTGHWLTLSTSLDRPIALGVTRKGKIRLKNVDLMATLMERCGLPEYTARPVQKPWLSHKDVADVLNRLGQLDLDVCLSKTVFDMLGHVISPPEKWKSTKEETVAPVYSNIRLLCNVPVITKGAHGDLTEINMHSLHRSCEIIYGHTSKPDVEWASPKVARAYLMTAITQHEPFRHLVVRQFLASSNSLRGYHDPARIS